MSDVLIIIPTYNESEAVEAIAKGVFEYLSDAHILFVDDNSPDGTANKILKLQEVYSKQIFLLSRQVKDGLGKAYVAGFIWALERNYNFIFEMDADFSHHPKYLPEMLEICRNNEADFVIGSRYVRGGSVKNWDLKRVLISRTASLYTQIFSGMPIKDPTAGFICYHASVLRAINLNKLEFIGYAFQIEMKFIALQKGFSYKEIPISFTDRITGVSKMNIGIVKEGISGVLRLRWNALCGRYKKK